MMLHETPHAIVHNIHSAASCPAAQEQKLSHEIWIYMLIAVPMNKLTNAIPLYKVTQETVLIHPLAIPHCVDFDIRWTFKSWERRIYLWCLLLRNNAEFVIWEKHFHCCTWYSPLYWIGNSHEKENSGVLRQLDLLEIMPCIICTCCKFDQSLGHQSDAV